MAIREKVMAIIASDAEVLEMSPNKASRSSGSGVMIKPIAKLKVKNMPTKVSVESLVLFSISQIKIMLANKAAKAPKKGLKLKRIPKAKPGKATWDRASPTKDIFLKTIKEPKYPEANPTKVPVIMEKIMSVFMVI